MYNVESVKIKSRCKQKKYEKVRKQAMVCNDSCLNHNRSSCLFFLKFLTKLSAKRKTVQMI